MAHTAGRIRVVLVVAVALVVLVGSVVFLVGGGSPQIDDECERTGALAESDSLARFRAASASDATESLDILAVGDSLTEGFGAASPNTRLTAVLVEHIREALGAPGQGRGFVPVRSTAHGGVWTVTGAVPGPDGLVGRGARLAAGGWAEALLRGDEFRVLFDTSPEGGQLRMTVDDRPPAVVSAAAATEGIGTWSTGSLPTGNHRVRVEAIEGTPVVHGVAALDGEGDAGVRLWDAGASGATTVTLAQTATVLERFSAAVEPDLVLVSLGGNDRALGVPVATFEAGLRSIVEAAAQPAGDPPSVVVWVAPRQQDATDASWRPYTEAMARVARDTGAGLADVGGVIGAAQAGVLFVDEVHPTDEGHAALGGVLAGALGVFACDVVQGWVTTPGVVGLCVIARDPGGDEVGTAPVRSGGHFEIRLDRPGPELQLSLRHCGVEQPTVDGPVVAGGTPFIVLVWDP